MWLTILTLKHWKDGMHSPFKDAEYHDWHLVISLFSGFVCSSFAQPILTWVPSGYLHESSWGKGWVKTSQLEMTKVCLTVSWTPGVLGYSRAFLVNYQLFLFFPASRTSTRRLPVLPLAKHLIFLGITLAQTFSQYCGIEMEKLLKSKNYTNWYNLVRSVCLKCHTFVASLNDFIYPEGAPASGLMGLLQLTVFSQSCLCDSLYAVEL